MSSLYPINPNSIGDIVIGVFGLYICKQAHKYNLGGVI